MSDAELLDEERSEAELEDGQRAERREEPDAERREEPDAERREEPDAERREEPDAGRRGALDPEAADRGALDPEAADRGELDPEAGEREELDPEVKARRDAALAHVRKLGDPVLRATALPVQRFDAALAEETERMGKLMGDALGIGLAATQLGVLHRVLVYRADPEQPVTALVNPVIEWSSEETEAAEEGCLSIPGVHVEVERPAQIRVSAQDPSGEELRLDASGLEARVIQHEVDHLDGVLILDRISREARRDAMRAMREALAAADGER